MEGKGHGLELSNLAPDVIESIINQVKGRRILSNIVYKELDKDATKEVFQNVFMSLLEEHVSTWASISESNTVRKIPRHTIIHTQSNIEDENYIDTSEAITEAFKTALAALSKFPNLESIETGFTSNAWETVSSKFGKM
jgi:hypothetical protein